MEDNRPLLERNTLLGVVGNKDYHLVVLTPDEFLALTPPIGPDEDTEFRNGLIKKHMPWNEMPYLIIEANKVVAHEGRHRALVLKEWGVPYMLVEVRNEWMHGLPRPMV